tara:strand:+ start:871 stop:1488 length:618 start_codon:yes stop_codon:yes gene_type:complete
MYNKPIIVFEGVECSGKSTHVSNVIKHLKKKGVKFISIREPGGNIFSEKIRQIILNKKSNLHKFTDLLLYQASRNENVDKIIRKNYKKKVIIIDRFTDSTVAYQHYGMNINLNIINKINKFILKDLSIGFTFLNIVNTKNLKLRLKKRLHLNKYDKFKINFYNKVQKGYMKISKNKKKYLIINSNQCLSKNKSIIIDKVNKILKI